MRALSCVPSRPSLPGRRKGEEAYHPGSRKLGCDGRHPCGRCIVENRECMFLERPRRTPLTRAHMTELEDRVEVYEKLLRGFIPDVSIDEMYSIARNYGIDAAIEKVKTKSAFLSDLPGPSAYQSSAHSTQALDSSSHSSHTPHGEYKEVDYPRTEVESASPPIPPLAVSLDKDPSTYEWHEGRESSSGQTDQAVQDGMGGAQGEQGVSYMGLSSSATFVNAIRRLSSQPTFSTSPSNPMAKSPFDVATFLGGLPLAKTPVERPAMRMPPSAEIRPYVDSYFAYFRESPPAQLLTCPFSNVEPRSASSRRLPPPHGTSHGQTASRRWCTSRRSEPRCPAPSLSPASPAQTSSST